MSSIKNDTINDAKKRALRCFQAGINGSANPYRNLPSSTQNAALYSAFEDKMNNLHFKDSCDDYDTIDGTGVRDYIHVVDLALGHLKALDNMAIDNSRAASCGDS